MSKFKGILDAVKGKEASVELENPSQDTVVANLKPVEKSIAEVNLDNNSQAEPQREVKRGRPKGKRSHPDYEQVTAYIRKETHNAIKIALLQEGQKREFSELIQDLLDEWLKSRT